MAAALPSSPPPAQLRPKTLSLREPDRCSPEREADREACAAWQREWIRKNRITIDTLGEILGLTYGAAQAKYEARRLFTVQDIRRFPAKRRRELMFQFVLWCDATDVSVPSKHI